MPTQETHPEPSALQARYTWEFGLQHTLRILHNSPASLAVLWQGNAEHMLPECMPPQPSDQDRTASVQTLGCPEFLNISQAQQVSAYRLRNVRS